MRRIGRLIGHPGAKDFSLAMTDRMHRCASTSRTARMWRGLLEQLGPHAQEGFLPMDRCLMQVGAFASRLLPGVVVPAIRTRLRAESRAVILEAEDRSLTRYLEMRKESGMRCNLNQLGEAVLGEEKAANRLEALIGLLGRPDVNYVSVKISAIFSQINLVAREHSLATIKERLRPLYRIALREDKFVNLDMEEYDDLDLTVQAFRELLEEEEFHALPAGIVLQDYLPDSVGVQEELTEWAKRRIAGGALPSN